MKYVFINVIVLYYDIEVIYFNIGMHTCTPVYTHTHTHTRVCIHIPVGIRIHIGVGMRIGMTRARECRLLTECGV